MLFLTDEDALSTSHIPAIQVLGTIRPQDFEEVIHAICHGTGFGSDVGGCDFWDDLDDYDRAHTPFFEGVDFGAERGDSVILSYAELLYYMEKASRRFLSIHPEVKDHIESDLSYFKETYVKRRKAHD